MNIHNLTSDVDLNSLIRYLHFALDENKIRRQDGLAVIADVAKNAVGAKLAWNFYTQNWPSIRET